MFSTPAGFRANSSARNFAKKRCGDLSRAVSDITWIAFSCLKHFSATKTFYFRLGGIPTPSNSSLTKLSACISNNSFIGSIPSSFILKSSLIMSSVNIYFSSSKKLCNKKINVIYSSLY